MHKNITMTRKLLTCIVTVMLCLTACHHKDEPEEDVKPDRTVLVYMSGENSLSDFVQDDLYEMLKAKTDVRRHRLLVYIDDNSRRMPFLARVLNGVLTDSVSLKDMGISRGDTLSSDPSVMASIINYAFHKYPSRENDYGLVMWGHASGWVLDDSVATKKVATARRRAYGIDNGTNSGNTKAWININSMAKAFEKVPHLKFIFADCCHFMCLESLYELRDAADYIIGSPAEIPDVGAPYITVAPALFEPDSFYTAIINRYYEQTIDYNLRVPLSAVKTSEMINVAKATRMAFQQMADTLKKTKLPDTKGLIHYYYSPLFIDANDFILRFASTETYDTWKQALDNAVVYKKMATRWMTNASWTFNYSDFEMTEERYGGVSMFVPQDGVNNATHQLYNDDIKKTSWYHATNQSSLGW